MSFNIHILCMYAYENTEGRNTPKNYFLSSFLSFFIFLVESKEKTVCCVGTFIGDSSKTQGVGPDKEEETKLGTVSRKSTLHPGRDVKKSKQKAQLVGALGQP